MLARRLTTILPAMTLAEAIETTRIHSVAGLTGDRTALVTARPFRAPHHTLLDAGLIGGDLYCSPFVKRPRTECCGGCGSPVRTAWASCTPEQSGDSAHCSRQSTSQEH
jgi:Magnesium chelatase, subunit ChlI